MTIQDIEAPKDTAPRSATESVLGTCRLCQLHKPLRKSHIKPKFVWKDSGLTAGNRSFSIRSETHPELSRSHQQDGFKEYLLCDDCERRFGRYESYAKPMLFGPTSPIMVRPTLDHVWTGLDYTLMKLFQLSILWRMAVSANPYYAFVEMDPADEETLRQMLLSDDPGEPWQYGCLVVTLRYHGKPLLGFFTQPRKITIGANIYYRLVLAGMQWLIYTGKSKPQEFLESAFLSRAGTWGLMQGEAEDFEYLRLEIEDHKKWLLAGARP